MPYRLPTEHERRALFQWLKQASSLTAWRRLRELNKAFGDVVESVYEEEQRVPGSASTISGDKVASILRNQDSFEAALERLARGDRRCFTFLGARGHFNDALLSVEWFQDMYGGMMYGRNGWDPADSPRWPEIERAMDACISALSDIGVVLQPRFTDVPAPLRSVDTYLSVKEPSLPKHWLAQPSLPPVPVAEPEVLIRTGREIPFYGIWEPVQERPKRDLWSILKGTPEPDQEPLQIDGCMNYLHAGFDAPTIDFPEDNQRNEGRRTTWRLLWRDDRYGPKPVPEEEAHYTFVRPVPASSTP